MLGGQMLSQAEGQWGVAMNVAMSGMRAGAGQPPHRAWQAGARHPQALMALLASLQSR